MFKNKIHEQDEIIKTLRLELIGATAKLTDVQGEMTEKQKRELEKNKSLVHEQTRELSDTRSQLVKLSEIVEKQALQIETLKCELKYDL